MPPIRVLATERPDLPHNTEAETPGTLPNVCVVVMPALQRTLVRGLRTFIQTFLAALLGGAAGPLVPGVSDVLPPGQFGEKALAALYIAAIAAGVAVLQNAGELLAQLDDRAPEWRG